MHCLGHFWTLPSMKPPGYGGRSIFQTPEARKTLQSKQLAEMTQSMVLQVVSWEPELTDFLAIAERGDIQSRPRQGVVGPAVSLSWRFLANKSRDTRHAP